MWKLNSHDTSNKSYKGTHAPHETHKNRCYDTWVLYDTYLLYRLSVHETLTKYVKIKPHITGKIDTFYQRKMAEHYCIDVLVRYALNHIIESPDKHLPELEDYFREMDLLLQEHQDKSVKIYIATDSKLVIEAFHKRYPSKMLVYIEDAFRSERQDSHLIGKDREYWLTHKDEFHTQKPGYKGGVETLMDCIFLSKCNCFIHATSNLATFVAFFSPHIDSIFLPKDTRSCPCPHKNRIDTRCLRRPWHLYLS